MKGALKISVSENNKKSGTSGLPSDKLLQALYWAEDVMERISHCPFILLKDTARCVKKEIPLEGDGIDVGILQKEFTERRKSTMQTDEFRRTVGDIDIVDNRFVFNSKDEVPIRVHIVKGRWSFFENPNIRFFGVGDYFLPNPFNNYWKARHLVK